MLASENLPIVEAFDTSTFRGGGRLLFGSSAARAQLLRSRQKPQADQNSSGAAATRCSRGDRSNHDHPLERSTDPLSRGVAEMSQFATIRNSAAETN